MSEMTSRHELHFYRRCGHLHVENGKFNFVAVSIKRESLIAVSLEQAQQLIKDLRDAADDIDYLLRNGTYKEKVAA